MEKETISDEMEIRNQVSDLVDTIDSADLPGQDKKIAIDYAIKMLQNLKETL